MSGSLVGITQVAGATPFDNSTSGLVATNLQAAVEELAVSSINPATIIKKILLDTDGTKASILFDADSILYEA
jgi:hypothetical protein